MKKANWCPASAKAILILTAGIVTGAFSSCGTRAAFQGSSVVPAARGSVKITKDRNKNYNIEVDMVDLAEPGRLTPAKNCYVIWMVSESNDTTNIGQIKSSSSMLSRTLKGSFATVSSKKPSKIFITAEDQGNIQFAGSVVVLTANNL